jgi:phytoene dehydrogenase-like protein
VILFRNVQTPLDIERTTGLSEGNIFQGELSLEQLFFSRPVPGYARFRTPIRDLWLCGSSTHPGGGIMGANGRIAAMELLRARGRKACLMAVDVAQPVGRADDERWPGGYEAIVVGGGHNALVTAAYLARAGRQVLVLERRNQLGGAAETSELGGVPRSPAGPHRRAAPAVGRPRPRPAVSRPAPRRA